jgi:hypothetical protein
MQQPVVILLAQAVAEAVAWDMLSHDRNNGMLLHLPPVHLPQPSRPLVACTPGKRQ